MLNTLIAAGREASSHHERLQSGFDSQILVLYKAVPQVPLSISCIANPANHYAVDAGRCLLKIFDAEVMIDGEGFAQRSSRIT